VPHEVGRKATAYVADDRRSTHPVAPLADEVPDVDAALANFDAISYAKGNSLLHQLVTWMGDEAFLAGVNDHLTRHAFGNAGLAEFVAALDRASDRDVAGWVQRWLRTSGFDTIHVTRDGDVPVLTREGSRPHRLTVTAYDDAMRPVDERVLDLADEPVRLEQWAGRVVVPNSAGETFARLRLDERSWDAVASTLWAVDDPMTRSVLWSTAFDLAHTGGIGPDEYVDLVARNLARERHASIVASVLGHLLVYVMPHRMTAGESVVAAERVAAACLEGLDAGPDPEMATALMIGVTRTSHDDALLTGWLADELDPGLRWRVVRRLAELGAWDEAAIEEERVRDGSGSADLAAATARAARPTPAAKAAAWSAMAEDPEVSNRMFAALADGLWSPEQAALGAPYVGKYLEAAPAIAARRGPGFANVVGSSFPRMHLDDAQLDALREALAGDVPTVLRRQWEDELDDRQRSISSTTSRPEDGQPFVNP
jgi:aminopeptidase N